MREIKYLKKDLEFSNNIAEISSISLECVYEANHRNVKGSFLVDGTFRSHEISLNQAEFGFKIPFEYEYEVDIVDGSAMVNVKDFTYTIDSNILSIDIEYETFADEEITEEEFLEKEEFDRFLDEHEVEIVDLSEGIIEKEEIKEEEPKEIDHLEIEPVLETEENLIYEIADDERNNSSIAESLIKNTKEEETYITYHVYVVTENDSIENIANKFKITIDTLKNYNNIDEINVGMKLIIPTDE